MYLLVQKDYIHRDAQVLPPDTDIIPSITVLLKAYPPQKSPFTSIWKEKKKKTMLLEDIRKTLQREPIWSEENHPELSTPEEIDQYVRNLRTSWRISQENE